MSNAGRAPFKHVAFYERLRMRDMRKHGHSLRAIGKVTGRNNAAVLHHVRDIPPPEGGWERGGRPTIHGKYCRQREEGR